MTRRVVPPRSSGPHVSASSINRLRRPLTLVIAGAVALAVAITVAILAGTPADPLGAPSTAQSPSTSPSPNTADVTLQPLEEDYPSVWELLHGKPTVVTEHEAHLFAQDGTVWTVNAAAGSIGSVSQKGDVTWVVEDLPTDNGQEWFPVAADGAWLAYADTAVMHGDGPSTAGALFTLHVPSGETRTIVERDFAELEAWGEHGSWGYPTSSRFAGERIWWIDFWTSEGWLTDMRLMSQPLDGSESTEHLRDAFVSLADQGCSSAVEASVRVRAYDRHDVDGGGAAHIWEVTAGSEPERLSPPEGIVSALNEPEMCGDVLARSQFEPLDGGPMPNSISANEGDPAIMMNALEITTTNRAITMLIADDSGTSWSVSMTGGWALVGVPDGMETRYRLINTLTGEAWKVDAPTGTVLTFARVEHGHLVLHVDSTALDDDWYSADAWVQVPLPPH